MNTMSAEEMKNRTIESLIFPDGGTRLAVLETRPVQKLTQNVAGLVWYHEDEKQFIVELPDEELSYKKYRSVDELLADGWVLIP